ncbi:hypothetical protein ACFOON_16365 [Novosphingobium piscinae]|uniref:Uncharacterized protein n=1 Tax=Novosphingobium piscinae TaxID=1507448 RepID=A0A7X1FYJ3_9SPHN|nr:hypothetical protein [Novosphingobium piscinae]MBC2669364.1 hypothetical protein [Novosphingobium piscinae]
MSTDLVVVAWNGTGDPFALIARDAVPAFRLAAFCYTGAPHEAWSGGPVYARATQCKGEAFSALIAALEAEDAPLGYVGFIDDDVVLSVSGINAMLADARRHGHASFSASLSADSHLSHRRFVTRPGGGKRAIAWVEVMAPFIRWEMLRRAGPLIAGNTSSYGIDQFVMPMLQRMLDLPTTVIYDDVVMRHTRPITSDGKVFRNGLTADQERVAQRARCLAHLRVERPDLCWTPWWFAWAAPWDGPARFWLPRLLQPFAPLLRWLRR